MGKRLQQLPPVGSVIADEVKALGIKVKDLCAMAHISRTSYYALIKGALLTSKYTADSCAA